MGSRAVLVVEDDRITAMDIVNGLEHLGYRVLAVVPTGEEAVGLAGGPTDKPDVVLMDIRLYGDMDGVEAAAAIRLRQDIPIIFLTVVTDMDILRRAMALDPAGYLVKPFEHAELGTTLEIALCRHDAERALRESRERLQALLDHAPCALFVLQDGICRLANAACGRLCGCAADQIPAHGPLGLVHKDYCAAAFELLALSKSVASGNVVAPKGGEPLGHWRKTLLLVDGQGREAWCDVSTAPMLFEDRPALACSVISLPGRC